MIHANRESGQTLIYLLTILAFMMLMALWLYDMNTGILSRIKTQNAADASALSAAQWQARSLNAVGEINLVKAINALLDSPPPGGPSLNAAISGASDDGAAYAEIQKALDSLQIRIQFAGPALALLGAQQAAKNNGTPVNDTFTQSIRQHAELVETTYKDAFTTPSWGAGDWTQDYAKMLNFVADEGVAAAPDNADFYGSRLSASAEAQRWLLDKAFYRAIAIRNWCYVEDIIKTYDSYEYWGQIQVLPQATVGGEYFGLGLEFADSDSLTGDGGLDEDQFQKLRDYLITEMATRDMPLHTDWPHFIPSIQWAVYNKNVWGPWDKAETYEESLLANPREKYDYSGCDAVTMVINTNNILLALNDRSEGWKTWVVGDDNQEQLETSVKRLDHLDAGNALDVRSNAAAKPFGQLPNIDEPAYTFRMVLPVYDQVRLIPIALASSFGNSDPLWLIHKTEHLPLYSTSGPDALPSDCFYCQQLKAWEVESFRQEGIDWLNEIDPDTGKKAHECLHFGGGGGGGGHGGVPIAH